MKNFTLADRKRNLVGFFMVPPAYDLSWIENTVDSGGGGGGTTTPYTQPYSATPAFVFSNGSPQTITLTGDVASSTLTGGTEGARLLLRIVQDSAGLHAFNFPANVRLDPGYAVSQVANTATILDLEYVNAKWESVAPPVMVPLP